MRAHIDVLVLDVSDGFTSFDETSVADKTVAEEK